VGFTLFGDWPFVAKKIYIYFFGHPSTNNFASVPTPLSSRIFIHPCNARAELDAFSPASKAQEAPNLPQKEKTKQTRRKAFCCRCCFFRRRGFLAAVAACAAVVDDEGLVFLRAFSAAEQPGLVFAKLE
jgi:hypothetical protein